MDREEIWDIEGVATFENGDSVDIRYVYKYGGRYGMSPKHMDRFQDSLKAKLMDMVEDLNEEDITFTVKKRKPNSKKGGEPSMPLSSRGRFGGKSFIEHEACLEPEPTPVELPGDGSEYIHQIFGDLGDAFDYGRGDI